MSSLLSPLSEWALICPVVDIGVAKLIADGTIKIKQGSDIVHFTPTGVVFADGTELNADAVIFAYGSVL